MSSGDSRRDGGSDLDAADVAAVRRAMAGLRTSPAGSPTGRAPRFADLESWVSEFFVLTFGRRGAENRWCERWWDHPEAVLRLATLWRTWETAADDPAATGEWLRDQLDPCLAILFRSTGPFAACDARSHEASPVLPVTPPPDGWWSAAGWWDVMAEDDR